MASSLRPRCARIKRGKVQQFRPRLEFLEDRLAPATFAVLNTNNAGLDSLRQAILDANASPGADLITFNIGGGGVQTIAPTSGLPTISDPVTVDGTTQPGFAGSPIIELNGASAGVGASGLFITAGNCTVRGLVINRFASVGVILTGASGNVVEGNYIGTDVSGTLGLGNGQLGVNVVSGSTSNRIGTNGDGVNDAAEFNVIAGNGVSGVGIRTDGNVVAGNFIGTDKTGTLSIPHPGDAVFIGAGARFNRIGTNADGMSDALERNILARSLNNGIRIDNAHDNVVAGNYIGTTASGNAALPNTTGILIHNGASGNLIGANGDGNHDDVERNIVSGNSSNGFFITGVGTNNNVVAGNYIGTTAGGAAALGNGIHGVVLVDGPRLNRIGTDGNGVADYAERNVISASGIHGVLLLNPSTDSNVVAGNYIGTNAAGAAALANTQAGVAILNGAHHNRIGTLGTEADPTFMRNLISGNGTFGVTIDNSGSNNNVVRGNFIGTDVTGLVALGNGDAGVMMRNSANNVIGGTTAAARNVVAANGGSGALNAAHGIVMFLSGATGNIVQGNYVGTNVTGTAALGNVGGGVVLNGGAHDNLVGTDGDGVNDDAEGNLISGQSAHEGAGIILAGTGTNRNLIAGNRIGTDVTGTAALANNTGVFFYPGPQANRIGASAALANTIAFNRFHGVNLLASATTLKNRIQANSIYANGGLGIDLGSNGFTLNDALDADSGSNDLQNFPVIISTTPGATTTIFGRFHSKPNTTYTLDFYASAAADPSGFGEGQRYLGAATVTTDANGDVHYFTLTVPGSSAAGEVISATATDPEGNTSEFSGNRKPTASAAGPYVINEGAALTLDASTSADPDFDVLSYSWDINGDGIFGDATGVQPTLSWAQLNVLGINDGPHVSSVRVRLDDDAGHVVTSSPTTLTVMNVVPTANISGPTDGVRGQTRTYFLSAIDPCAADQAAGFEYSINWGDSSPLQIVPRTAGNGSGVAVNHVFVEEGDYNVVVTATDDDDGVSPTVSLTTKITILAVQADPCDSTKTTLVIGGTSEDDHIVFNPGGDGDVQVIFNGASLGTYQATGAIIAHGQGGNDNIQVAGSITLTSWLYGDEGNDRLFAGGGPSILLGGTGDDDLLGGSSRDLLIGGLGCDHLVGNSNDDILIGGYTSFDANEEALCAIMDEWTSSRDYSTRVANLKGVGSGPRANGDYVLIAKGDNRTVFDDAAEDRLVGSSGQDWFFANIDSGVLDVVTGLTGLETVQDIDE